MKKYSNTDPWYHTMNGRFKSLLRSAKKRAIKKNLPFELTLEWLYEKYRKQKGKCLLTNLKLEIKDGIGINPLSPSLDRKDPAKGYTINNTRLVCTAINIALSNFGDLTFEKIANGFIKRKEKRDAINNAKRTKESREKTSKSTIGSKNPRAKLNEEIVLSIRKLWDTKKYTQIELSKEFKIPATTINHILKKYTWKHI